MRAPGRKVGRLSVRLDRPERSGLRTAPIEVELRLSVGDGMFHAEYEGAWYDALTRDELCAKIRQAAQKTIDVQWTRYLVVDYEARAWPLDGDAGRPETDGHGETLSIDEDRATLARDPRAGDGSNRSRTRAISSIDLRWAMREFSSPYSLPEDKTKIVRMSRRVRSQRCVADGRETYQEIIDDPVEQHDDQLPAGAVPWTAAREALLRDALAALGELDALMVELFRGDPEQLARQLDALARQDPARFLAAPAAKGE